MSAFRRTQDVARAFIPWRAAGTELGAFARRPAFALRAVWHALIRKQPERRYERRILKRLANGDLTNTLGVQIRDEPHIRATSEKWLAELVILGLDADHLCVEYGCGSLWCAEPVIRYLKPRRFIGLDITDRFYDLGCQRLDALASEKQIALAKISRSTLSEVAALKPDFVYSHRVLHHVPRRALARYMRNITSLLNQQTVLVAATPRYWEVGARTDSKSNSPTLVATGLVFS
jgi:Methyltransferase domain